MTHTGTTADPTADGWGADHALEQLYAVHWRGLVRLAVLLVREVGLAEEVVQDAFVATHGRWSSLRDPDRALAYLRQAVVNRSRSALRHAGVVEKHRRRLASEAARPDPGGAGQDGDPDRMALLTERRRTVVEALARLPRRQREVLVLRYYAEASESEIAEILDISRGAVKSHASRGAAKLRDLLEADR
ncbi:SigE family RNA polymerase sigma factor [uncultured Nocardioides sp.]|uniref:SigE family RNA polymerase sigma factor n=1 Tax=uncultured Nocardioides sp. TaxID=198441 RepID=UPI00262972C1|nr:SigE family RNA polymerase sigma factor [uncultured Nocardioides sp.]